MPVIADLVARFRYDDSQAVATERRINQSLERTAQKAKQVANAMATAARSSAGGGAGGGRSLLDRQQVALANELARTQAALSVAMAGGSREAQTLAGRFHALTAAQRAEVVAAREALSAQRDREGAFRRLGDSMKSVGATMTAGITAPLVGLGIASVRSATQMDSLKRGLTAVAGSSEEAERQLVRLREIAKLPGLGRVEAIAGAIQLQAAGLSAQTAEKSLLAFGNALATVGKGKAELDGVTLALSQIAAKGKVSAEEINQLAERVPQIRQAMRAAFGTANTELLQKQGIGARRFIEGITTELLKLPRVTGGVQNAFENLGDVVGEALGEIGRNLLPTVLPAVEKLTAFLKDLTRQFAALPQPVRSAILGLAGLAAATGPAIFAGGQLLAAWGQIRTAAPIWGERLRDVGAALLSAPGWTKVAIIAVGAMVLAWQRDFLGIRTTVTEFVQWITPTLVDTWNFAKDETSRIWGEMVAGIKGFIQEIKDAWSGIGEGIGAALLAPFRAFSELLAQLPPQVQTALKAAFKNTPLGAVAGLADFGRQFGERLTLYTNLRQHMQRTWDQGLLKNQPGGGGGGPRPDMADEPLTKQVKQLTPLEQELLQIQAQLNAAQVEGRLKAQGYTGALAKLGSQYRHVAASSEHFGKLLELERVQAGASLKEEEDRARGLLRTQELLAKQARERALAAESLARGVQPNTAVGGELARLEIAQQFTKASPALDNLIDKLAQAKSETAGWDERTRKATETSQKLQQVQESLGQTAEAGQRELAKIISPHNFRTGLFLWQELGIEFDDLTDKQQLLAHSIVQIAKDADQYRTRLELWRDAASGIHDVFSSAFMRIGEGFGGLVDGIRHGFSQMLLKMAADFISSQLTKTLMGFLGGVLGPNLGGFFSKGGAPVPIGMAGGGLSAAVKSSFGDLTLRAGGGPFSAGRPMIVGERGPELVMPNRSGYVVPNHALATAGAGAPINITVNLNGVTDFASFRRNEAQFLATVQQAGARAARRNRG